MACYKNETKHKCSKVVMIVSILAICMGLLTAIFGFAMTGGADDLMKKGQEAAGADADAKQYSASGDLGIKKDATAGTMVIIGGILCIIVGVFGGLTVKFKKVYFAVPFVAMSFIIALFMIIGAFIALGDPQPVIDEGCKFLSEELKVAPQDMYKALVDSKMCTDICPCDETLKSKWMGISQTKLEQAGRFVAKVAEQDETTYVNNDFVFKAAGDGVHSSYKTCWENVISKEVASAGNEKALEWMKTKGAEMLTTMEERYDCAGMCKSGLFYFQKSLDQGAASKDCLRASVEKMAEGTGPAGVVALLSGLALIVAGIGGFPLCTGFNDKSEEVA